MQEEFFVPNEIQNRVLRLASACKYLSYVEMLRTAEKQYGYSQEETKEAISILIDHRKLMNSSDTLLRVPETPRRPRERK